MISIVLPTYNSIDFLKERVDTILEQTYTTWECVVIDGESKDGTWEYLTEIAKTDNRFRLYQYAPKGVYNAWNIGVKQAKGDYIYFATSDDTMTSNCLEKLLLALQEHPQCSIAHSNLKIIDKHSNLIEGYDWKNFYAQQYFKALTDQYHIRKAPLVGVLYATHQTIIHSFTQVLISKQTFDNCGYFLEDMGHMADLEWGMRVGFTEQMVHVPLVLSTWRVHENQLTQSIASYHQKATILKLMALAIENASNSKDIKKNKFYLLAWTIKSLYYKSSILKKITTLNLLKFFFIRLTNKEFKEALQTRDCYQAFLQSKLGITINEQIELL